MKYKRRPQEALEVEAVQLISKRIDGDKLITFWSSRPDWLIDEIKYHHIYSISNDTRSANSLILSGIYGEDELFESNWLIKEKQYELQIMEDDYFLDNYDLDEGFNYEKYVMGFYKHDFDIK